MSTLHDTDFVAWTEQQARLLRERRFEELDVDELLEEIEDMGGSERRALESRLAELLLHLLKWKYQPARRTRSWRVSIAKQRVGIERVLRQNPSLKASLEARYVDAYADARRLAAVETGLQRETFPPECPFQREDALAEEWLPE